MHSHCHCHCQKVMCTWDHYDTEAVAALDVSGSLWELEWWRKRETVTVLLLVMLSLQKTIRDGTWQYVCKITPFHHQVDSCLPPFTRKEFSLFPVLKEPVPLFKVNWAFSLHNSLEWHCLLRVSEMYRSYPYLKLLWWSTKLVFYLSKRRWRSLKRHWKCGPVACNLFSAVQQPRRVNSPPLELTS